MTDDGVFENALASSGFAKDEAKTALLAVNFEDVEVTLLMIEKWSVFIDGKRLMADAEVAFDHSVVGCLGWWKY